MASRIAIPSLVGACIHGYQYAKARQVYQRPVELFRQQDRKRRFGQKRSVETKDNELHQDEDKAKKCAATTTRVYSPYLVLRVLFKLIIITVLRKYTLVIYISLTTHPTFESTIIWHGCVY